MPKRISTIFNSWRPKLNPISGKLRKQFQLIEKYPHFTSGIFFAHAINTPLTSLTLLLEQALVSLSDQPHLKEEQQQLTQALASAKHLQQLMLLKSSTHRNHSFFVKTAITEVITRLSDSESRVIASSLLLSDELRLSGPAFFFQEALSCLITNGFEAYQRKSKKPIALIALENSQYCLIYICDSGTGMDWLTQQLVTIRGFSRKKFGLGQGMSLAKFVIEELLAGQLLINSQSNAGTVLVIKLPLRR